METQHVFKPGDEAWTIWGEEVRIIHIGHQNNKEIGFHSFVLDRNFIINNNNTSPGFGHQIVYPHPVKVVPVPEFEEGEEIEMSDDMFFRKSQRLLVKARFICRQKDGFIIAEDRFGALVKLKFARKITKPEKTIEQIKDELIERQTELLGLIIVENKRQINEYRNGAYDKLTAEISSLQEQLNRTK